MERAVRTIATGIAVVTLFYALFLPGGLPRRAGVGLAAATLGMAVFLGGMGLTTFPLEAGYLQAATALGLVSVFLTVDLPSRLVARLQDLELPAARGVTMMGMCLATFVAAWVAGPPPELRAEVERRSAEASSQPGPGAEVARGRP